MSLAAKAQKKEEDGDEKFPVLCCCVRVRWSDRGDRWSDRGIGLGGLTPILVFLGFLSISSDSNVRGDGFRFF